MKITKTVFLSLLVFALGYSARAETRTGKMRASHYLNASAKSSKAKKHREIASAKKKKKHKKKKKRAH